MSFWVVRPPSVKCLTERFADVPVKMCEAKLEVVYLLSIVPVVLLVDFPNVVVHVIVLAPS